MKLPLTQAVAPLGQPQLVSRRNWLPGLGALAGTGILPASLASPAVSLLAQVVVLKATNARAGLRLLYQAAAKLG